VLPILLHGQFSGAGFKSWRLAIRKWDGLPTADTNGIPMQVSQDWRRGFPSPILWDTHTTRLPRWAAGCPGLGARFRVAWRPKDGPD
jgi:hypothetical protein